MGFNINVDIGGTFTDLFAVGEGGEIRIAKTPTTHYDISVGFMKGIKELAREYDLALDDFLSRTHGVHYCTTVGTNALIERTGPKLGLITTAGFEDTIFIGRGRSWADGGNDAANKDLSRIRKPEPLISRDMVVGLRERIDCFGNIMCPLDPDEVRQKLQVLVDRGAMGFVVCLLWSFVNSDHEQAVKAIIEEEYPEDYLGSMPVTLSSQVSPKSGEYSRSMTAVVNAYIHGIMADELNRLSGELRERGYKRPLILAHNTGGMKKVSRTRAVLTHNAGPVAGLHGTKTAGQTYGYNDVVFTDMGGTSFDIGVVSGGSLRAYDFIPVIDRWRTNIPAVEVKSIGAGGGSIAWLNKLLANAIEVGPQSAGSMPGPACYARGGEEPTVTDADLVLGYLNPDNYLGGKMLLDPALSEEVIERRIAQPLGIDGVEAATRIRRIIDGRMGQEIFNEVALKGYDPRDFVLFACGGAGPTHACGFAPYLGVKKVIASPWSPVFGAFGASTMKIQQVWEKSHTIRIFRWANQSYSDDFAAFNSIVAELRDLALRDLHLEGYAEDQVELQLELDMRYGMQYNLTRTPSPHLEVHSQQDFKDIADGFETLYSSTYSPESTFPEGGINVECFYLTASVSPPKPIVEPLALRGPTPPEAAHCEPRRAHWAEMGGYQDAPVFTFELLEPGNVIIGPALIDARDTTYVIDPGWRLTMDRFRNAILERA